MSGFWLSGGSVAPGTYSEPTVIGQLDLDQLFGPATAAQMVDEPGYSIVIDDLTWVIDGESSTLSFTVGLDGAVAMTGQVPSSEMACPPATPPRG
ncbi:MAG: hypothetical protein RMK64_09115 [Rhodovarius sp.]|nr:hypothetical protein [Rhodovarius sp.]